MKRKARMAAAVVLAFLPIFGLLGCGESEKFTADDLVLIHTVYYGTERNPVYCFALKKEEKGTTKIETSTLVGKKLAEKALSAGIHEVVFDRNGYLYHGRVKALAEGAREGGLKF